VPDERSRPRADPAVVLGPFPERRAELVAAVSAPPPPPLDSATLDRLESSLDRYLKALEARAGESDPEAVSQLMFLIREETQAAHAGTLRDILVQLAPYPAGRSGIARALEQVESNPYPRYRDIALVALGAAAAAVPDPEWLRALIRSIIEAGLDAEGVTFTFELPAVVLLEARRRNIEADRLNSYVERGRSMTGSSNDRWGTGLRARIATAVALGWQGDRARAMAELQQAAAAAPGFAGYTSMAHLLLANRCIELGFRDRILDPVWGPAGRSLLDLAAEQAARVIDEEFRRERTELVRQYDTWLRRTPPDLDGVEQVVAITPDADTRRLYKDFAASSWVAAASSASRDWLKALVPMVLEDTTTLDAILGRVVGLRLRAMTDREVAKAAAVVETALMSGVPWAAGAWEYG
jgi:hypothetical protein